MVSKSLGFQLSPLANPPPTPPNIKYSNYVHIMIIYWEYFILGEVAGFNRRGRGLLIMQGT